MYFRGIVLKIILIKNCMHYNKGFHIKDNKGNNAFSYDMRTKYKSIYVSSLKTSDKAELTESDKIAFAEIEDEQEKGYKGIEPFLKLHNKKADIYIFDNHNHAFYFIYEQVYSKKIAKNLSLVHFDQHRDTRKPDTHFHQINPSHKELKDFFGFNISEKENISQLDKAYYYTNEVLNVGNFIDPLIEEGIIKDTIMMTSSYEIENNKMVLDEKEEFILDIDLDFFSEDMDYLKYEEKINAINTCIKKAALITICTSPFFVSFDRARKALKDIDLFN